MKANRETLLAALDQLKSALGSSGSIPELGHLWFNGKEAFAYDGGLGIRIPLESDIKLGLPGAPLLALLRSTSTPEVELAPGKRAGLEVKLGGGHATLTTMEAGRSPWNFPEDQEPVLSIPITEAVLDGLRRAMLLKVGKPSRVEHYGVTLFPTKDGLAMFTTDSQMMIRVLVPIEGQLEKARKIVLPRPFVEQVISQCAPDSQLNIMKTYLYAKGEGVEIFSNMLDNSGVNDLPSVVDQYKDVGIRVALPTGFGTALQRAAILAGGDTPYVMLVVDGENMDITGKYKHGRLQESLPLTGDAGEAGIKVAANRLPGLAEATDFALTQDVFLLFGGDDFLFLVASHDE